jgi:hypothetical protein
MDGAGGIILRCKCGWSMPAPRDESEALADEQMARFPDDDPETTWNQLPVVGTTDADGPAEEHRNMQGDRAGGSEL